jgi:hypothetical protein
MKVLTASGEEMVDIHIEQVLVVKASNFVSGR